MTRSRVSPAGPEDKALGTGIGTSGTGTGTGTDTSGTLAGGGCWHHPHPHPHPQLQSMSLRCKAGKIRITSAYRGMVIGQAKLQNDTLWSCVSNDHPHHSRPLGFFCVSVHETIGANCVTHGPSGLGPKRFIRVRPREQIGIPPVREDALETWAP